jgi:c-di-GMP-binding flagellar brake protein YcgR
MSTIHFRRVDRRRTPRVALFVDLIVQGVSQDNENFRSRTRSHSVSGHGGSMMLERTVTVGQSLLLTNDFSGEKAECRVVAVRTGRDGRISVAFEFVSAPANFWKMSFPHAGAKPLRKIMPTTAIA